jgi:hypothetical protein
MTSLQNPPSTLDRLPPDQQAVLQMVLGRGMGYDEIARLLSIDRAAVRDRALAALDALGPATPVQAPRRALITDYLLAQLPPRVSQEVRSNLAQSPSERAWARVLAAELAPLSDQPLPEIPTLVSEPWGQSATSGAERQSAQEGDGAALAGVPADALELGEAPGTRPRSSRLGGAVLLAVAAAAAIAAILIFVVFRGAGSTSHKARSGTPVSTKTSTSQTRPLAQINLTAPHRGKAVGIAEVLRAGGATALVIVAQGLKPNTKHDAYAVWLYSSSSDFYRLGYVQQAVTSNGKLQTAGRLPANASHFRQILVTLQSGPGNRPGKIVLKGALAGV